MSEAATGDFETQWRELKRLVESGELPSPKSAMWRNLAKDFSAGSPEDESRELFGPHSLRGYNFLRREYVPADLPLHKAFLWLTFAASAGLRKLSNAAWSFNLDRLAYAGLMGYPKYHRTLDAMGLGEEYRAFCGELGISPDSHNTSQLFYVSRRVRAIEGLPRGGTVLEVGAGTGNLAIMLHKLGLARRYVIVDLPEMLLHSSRTIRRYLPDVPVRFALQDGDGPLALPESGFLLVPNARFERLPGGFADLCVNIGSFQEMSREQVWGYMGLFRRASRLGAHWLTLNRRKTVGDWDNNPLLYPYGDNEVLRWEPDDFTFMALRVDRKDPFFLRVERVKDAP